MESWCDFSIMGELEGMVSRVEGVLRSFLSTLPTSPIPYDARVPQSSLCHWSAVVAASSGIQYRLTLLLPPESLQAQGTHVQQGGEAAQRDFGVSVATVCSDPLAQGGAPFLAHCSDAEAEDAALACSLRLKFGQLGGLLLVRSAHSGSDLIGSVERKEARTLLSTAVLAVENVGLRGSTAVVVQVAEPSQGAFIGSAWCNALGAHTALRAGMASIWEEEEEEEEEVVSGLGSNSSRSKGEEAGTWHQQQRHDSATAPSPSSSEGTNETNLGEVGGRIEGRGGGVNSSSLILNPLLTYPGLRALFERKLVNSGDLLKGKLPGSGAEGASDAAAVSSTTVALRWRLGRRALNIIAANLSVPPPLSALECVAVWDDKGGVSISGEGANAGGATASGLPHFPLAPTMQDFASRTSWVGLRWCGEDVVGRELLWGGVVEPTVLQPTTSSSRSSSGGGGGSSHGAAIPTPLLLCRACAPSPPYNSPPFRPVYKHSSGLAVLACGLRGAVALEKRGVGSLSRWGGDTALLSPLQISPHPSSSSPPFTTKLPSPPSSPPRITKYSSSLSSAFSPTPNAAGYTPNPPPAAATPATQSFSPSTNAHSHVGEGASFTPSSAATSATTATTSSNPMKAIPPSPATNATRALSRHLKEPSAATVRFRASGVSSASAATVSLDVGITTSLESVEGVVEGALAVWRGGVGAGNEGCVGSLPPPLSILSALVSGCATLCVNSLLNPGGGTALYDWLGHLVEEGINVDHGRGSGTWVGGGDGGRERMREWVRDGGMGYTAVCGGYLIEDGFVAILGGVWCLFLRQVRALWENIEWEEEEEVEEGVGGGGGEVSPTPITLVEEATSSTNTNTAPPSSVSEGVLDVWIDGPAIAQSNLPPLEACPLALQQHFWVLHQCIYPPTTTPSTPPTPPCTEEKAPIPPPPLFLYPSPPATHAEAMGDLQACSRLGITCPQALAYLGDSCIETTTPPVRARLSLPIVVSDMAAYKHWAGGASGDGSNGNGNDSGNGNGNGNGEGSSNTLAGFLRWYFKLTLEKTPLDVSSSAEPKEEKGERGVESPWLRLWDSVEPCPATSQRPLFRPNAVAQRTLLHLEDLSPVDVCLQLVALFAWCSGELGGKGEGDKKVVPPSHPSSSSSPSSPPHPLLSTYLSGISTATTSLVEHCASILLPLSALSTGISARESSSSSSSRSDGSSGGGSGGNEDGGKEAREAIREEFIREAGGSLDAEITGLTARVLALEACIERWEGLGLLLGKCHHAPHDSNYPGGDGGGGGEGGKEGSVCHPLSTLAAHTSFPSHPSHSWEGPPGVKMAPPPGSKGMLSGGGALEGAFLLPGGHPPGEGEVCRLGSAWASCAPWGGVEGWECKGAVAALLLLCGDAVDGGSKGGAPGSGAFTLPPPHNVSMLLTSNARRDFIPAAAGEEEEVGGGQALRHTMLVTVDTGGGSFITVSDDNFLGKLALSLAIQERE